MDDFTRNKTALENYIKDQQQLLKQAIESEDWEEASRKVIYINGLQLGLSIMCVRIDGGLA